MLNIGPPELLLVLVIALIVVGPKKLPELARTIGRGLSEFRKVQDEVKDMVKLDLSMDPVTTPKPPPTPHRTPRPASLAPEASSDAPETVAAVSDASASDGSDDTETADDEDLSTPADPPAAE